MPGESVSRQHRMVVCRMTGGVEDEEDKCRAEKELAEADKRSVALREEFNQALGGQEVLPDD